MSARAGRAGVTLERRAMWSLRASLAATRWVLYAVAAAGVAVAVYNSIDPPARRTVRLVQAAPANADEAWLALRFARAYLSFGSDPLARERALAPFLSAEADPGAGMTPAPSSRQSVAWVEIAAESAQSGGVHDFTVAAATAGGGVRYLSVAVGRGAGGVPVLARYPALVAGPAPGRVGSLDAASLPTVADAGARAVLDRALGNYLADSSENLAADLAPSASVQPAASGLSLRSVDRLAIDPSGGVVATLLAADLRGDLFTLAYRLRLTRAGGRWEISRIGP